MLLPLIFTLQHDTVIFFFSFTLLLLLQLNSSQTLPSTLPFLCLSLHKKAHLDFLLLSTDRVRWRLPYLPTVKLLCRRCDSKQSSSIALLSSLNCFLFLWEISLRLLTITEADISLWIMWSDEFYRVKTFKRRQSLSISRAALGLANRGAGDSFLTFRSPFLFFSISNLSPQTTPWSFFAPAPPQQNSALTQLKIHFVWPKSEGVCAMSLLHSALKLVLWRRMGYYYLPATHPAIKTSGATSPQRSAAALPPFLSLSRSSYMSHARQWDRL